MSKSPLVSSFQYEYRGWEIEPYEGIGHRLENSRNISQQIGSHTARKISEYLIHYPEDFGHGSGLVKSVRTLKEAAAYIDRYEGSEDPAARMKKIPRVASSR